MPDSPSAPLPLSRYTVLDLSVARDEVSIAASMQRMWTIFCQTPAADHPLTHLVERLNAAGVPCGPIYDIRQAFEDPQAKHVRMTRPAAHPVLGELHLLRFPINMSTFPHPERFHHAGPEPGEHSATLLRELGYDDTAIDTMMTEGVVV
jgi:crotonobetainyl-CoA:carnitine CoA-transferase CaiB-like acyl-CoA transferase